MSPDIRPHIRMGRLGLLVLFVASCAAPKPSPGHHDVEPERTRRPPRVVGYHRYEVGGRSGYVESRRSREGLLHFVYDADWNLLGLYTGQGRTYRVRGDEGYEFLGQYNHDISIRTLQGMGDTDEPVLRKPIGPKMSLEDVEENRTARNG